MTTPTDESKVPCDPNAEAVCKLPQWIRSAPTPTRCELQAETEVKGQSKAIVEIKCRLPQWIRFKPSSVLCNPNAEIKFKGQILDNVHGFISYTDAEQKIMQTQLFRRLQSIKQLSVVNWVFPGSEHTRYIHSLGVMHVADKMAIALGLSNKERRTLRLAGLLHDIGHYPLSHVGETPYKSNLCSIDNEAFCASINQKVIDEQIEGFKIKVKTDLMTPSFGLHHEAVGAEIVKKDPKIREILEEELGAGAPEIIADIIVGRASRKEPDSLLVQVMHSELDADGIDYMMRDSAFAGTNFGAGEIDQLIRCLVKAEYEGKRIMCIRPKAIPAADQYLLNKFFHYSQVVFNRHIVVSEWMATQVINWMRQNNAIFPSDDKLHKWIKEIGNGGNFDGRKEYLAFTDNMFWIALEKILSDELNFQPPEYIRRFCQYLLLHDEPEPAKRHEIRIVSNNQNEIRERLKKAVIRNDPQARSNWITIVEERMMSKQTPELKFRVSLVKYMEFSTIDEEQGVERNLLKEWFVKQARVRCTALPENLPDEILTDSLRDFLKAINEDMPMCELKMEMVRVMEDRMDDISFEAVPLLKEEIEKLTEDLFFVFPEEQAQDNLTRRLQECICVRDYDYSLHLLCDDERSLMRSMYNQTVVMLRSYMYQTTE